MGTLSIQSSTSFSILPNLLMQLIDQGCHKEISHEVGLVMSSNKFKIYLVDWNVVQFHIYWWKGVWCYRKEGEKLWSCLIVVKYEVLGLRGHHLWWESGKVFILACSAVWQGCLRIPLSLLLLFFLLISKYLFPYLFL